MYAAGVKEVFVAIDTAGGGSFVVKKDVSCIVNPGLHGDTGSTVIVSSFFVKRKY